MQIKTNNDLREKRKKNNFDFYVINKETYVVLYEDGYWTKTEEKTLFSFVFNAKRKLTFMMNQADQSSKKKKKEISFWFRCNEWAKHK